MRVAIRFGILCAALLGACEAGAQGVVTQKILSLNAAKTIAEAALAECKKVLAANPNHENAKKLVATIKAGS